ncbi:hypothetical protein ALC56_12520 [Trachymyrmex septentrionalis]|uniref:Uncharacterized protein n=1 Tax=Trachymyrmex septentrionalis TaxID=34720 RepID=A0A195EZ54_9HYME|nr:hypothetical protein ALC56_12520 [Trachymyrmex septentrionalis]
MCRIDLDEKVDRSSVPTAWRFPGTPGIRCPIDSEEARPSSHVRHRPTDRLDPRAVPGRYIYFRPSKNNLVTGTTECTTLGELFRGGGGGGGGNCGSIPAVNDASVLILSRCNIARRWRSHGRGLAFSARFVVGCGRERDNICHRSGNSHGSKGCAYNGETTQHAGHGRRSVGTR